MNLTWVDVHAVTVHPLVVVIFPAVEVNLEEPADHPGDGAHADQTWVHLVRGFDFHADLE